MFKCYDCGSAYAEPQITYQWAEEGAKQHLGCHCGGPLGDAEQCQFCGEWFLQDDDFTPPYCHACAAAEYTPTLGLAFVASSQYEKDFTAFCYNLSFRSRSGGQGAAILFAAAQNAISAGLSLHRPSAEEAALKAFCLEDIDEWVDFLSCFKNQKHAG